MVLCKEELSTLAKCCVGFDIPSVPDAGHFRSHGGGQITCFPVLAHFAALLLNCSEEIGHHPTTAITA